MNIVNGHTKKNGFNENPFFFQFNSSHGETLNLDFLTMLESMGSRGGCMQNCEHSIIILHKAISYAIIDNMSDGKGHVVSMAACHAESMEVRVRIPALKPFH